VNRRWIRLLSVNKQLPLPLGPAPVRTTLPLPQSSPRLAPAATTSPPQHPVRTAASDGGGDAPRRDRGRGVLPGRGHHGPAAAKRIGDLGGAATTGKLVVAQASGGGGRVGGGGEVLSIEGMERGF
jgi:hypothetical protein